MYTPNDNLKPFPPVKKRVSPVPAFIAGTGIISAHVFNMGHLALLFLVFGAAAAQEILAEVKNQFIQGLLLVYKIFASSN